MEKIRHFLYSVATAETFLFQYFPSNTTACGRVDGREGWEERKKERMTRMKVQGEREREREREGRESESE